MSEFHSGFVAVLGKPNVGKSTLINQLVGTKVAITSSKPQTTRRRVLGVVHGDGFQAVLVDTPGLSEPRHALGRKMVKWATEEGREADLILLVVELTHPPTAEDVSAAELVQGFARPVLLVCNKVDRAPAEVDELRAGYRALMAFEAVHEVSATQGLGMAELLAALRARLPEGPPFFPPDQVSDQNQRLLIEEVLRERVLHNTRQEIPHAVAVQVEDMRPGENPDVTVVVAYLYVERPNQKKILIGKNGALLKKIGSEARLQLEQLLGQKLFLDLWVKVKADWRDREDWLRALGYE